METGSDPIEAKPTMAVAVDSEANAQYAMQPAQPQRRAPNPHKRPAGHMRPDLVELVIREMGRKDLFSKKTLKALRRTSRGFRAFIDIFFSSLSTVTVRNEKGIEQLLKCPSTIQTMETFRYIGSLSQATEMISGAAALMAANPSQLKKLVLNKAGLAFDILVHLSLPNLTSLELDGLDKRSKALERLCYKKQENVWPLREFELCSEHPVPHTILVPALKTFNQLRKLTLLGRIISDNGRLDPVGFLEDSFPKLETLDFDVNDPGGLGLLRKARLPSLRHLGLQRTICYIHSGAIMTSMDAPWLQQLQSLTLNWTFSEMVFSENVSVLSAFRSGALTSVVIQDWKPDRHALFESVHLPGLTSLELSVIYDSSGNDVRVISELATASFPLLSQLTVLGGTHFLVENDINSLSAFLQLRILSLTELRMKESDWGWFIINILPRLEIFGASDERLLSNICALGPPAAWPLLHNLTLHSSALVDILPIAPYFPSIRTLGVYSVYIRTRSASRIALNQQSSHQAIIKAAVNERAWPDLKYLSFSEWGWWHLKDDDVAVLKRAWPKVSMYEFKLH